MFAHLDPVTLTVVIVFGPALALSLIVGIFTRRKGA